jgi:hypothetical protein
MRVILRQLGRIMVSVGILYGLILCMTLVLAPSLDVNAVIDSSTAGETIFVTEPKYIYLNRGPLTIDRRNVVLLGGSNVNTGFVVSELNRILGRGIAVHNLGLGGANMTEVKQVFDLVREVQNDRIRRRDTFVIGIWYGLFGQDRRRWYTPDRVPGDTDIDIERYRYGFERRTPKGPVDVVSSDYRDAAVTAIYPFLFLDRLGRVAASRITPSHHKTDNELNSYVVDDAERQKYMQYWEKTMGPVYPTAFDEQFSVLHEVCDDHYAKLGFRLLEGGEDGVTVWQLDVAAAALRPVPMEIMRSGFTVQDAACDSPNGSPQRNSSSLSPSI